jgi:hypothetical protein
MQQAVSRTHSIKKEDDRMIKVTRRGVDITVTLTDEFGNKHAAATFCKSIIDAEKLAKTIRKAVKMGYGFVKCRAILEGDEL